MRDERRATTPTLGRLRRADLAGFDVVLMRQDPPFDMNYITTTHLLERIHPKTLVVNDPAEVRNAPEKIFVTEFPELMPPTLITRDRRRDPRRSARSTATSSSSRSTAMAAPASSASPRATRTSPRCSKCSSTAFREPFIVQRYLPEVRKGDKRIILIDGEPVGAINRVPAEGEVPLQHACRRPRRADRADRARARDLRRDRPGR